MDLMVLLSVSSLVMYFHIGEMMNTTCHMPKRLNKLLGIGGKEEYSDRKTSNPKWMPFIRPPKVLMRT
jgi:hypothetical protein